MQHLLKRDKEHLWKLIHDGGAHIYICGCVRAEGGVGEAVAGSLWRWERLARPPVPPPLCPQGCSEHGTGRAEHLLRHRG